VASEAIGGGAAGIVRRVFTNRQAVLLALLAGLVAVFSQTSEYFLGADNMLEVTVYSAEIGFMALPMTLILVVAGIDLSVGSILSLCAVFLGIMFSRFGVNLWIAVLMTLALGAVCGAVNGLLTAYLRLPALIVTLATMAIYAGLAVGMSKAESYRGFSDSFGALGRGYVVIDGGVPAISFAGGGIPVQLLLLCAFSLAVWIIFTRLPAGRRVAVIGSGPEAARCCGIRVERLLTALYAFSGFMSAVAAVVFVSRVASAKADAGTGRELDVITAVVLGGTSISGGKGSVTGSLLGLLVVGVVQNGLQLSGVTDEWRTVGVGALLIGATTVDRMIRGEEV